MNFTINYQSKNNLIYRDESQIAAANAMVYLGESKIPIPQLQQPQEPTLKRNIIQRGSMMWDFVTDALMSRRYGMNLHTVQQRDNRWIFAVRAINQKAFQPHQSGLKDQSWALFLDYGKLKGRKKPETSEEYTKLRSNFFNAIIRCACDGIISKVDRQTAADLGITLFKDYKYFMYEGENIQKYEHHFPIVDSSSYAYSRHNNGSQDSNDKYPNPDRVQNDFEGPLPQGDYLFSVSIDENGKVINTKLLGAMPDNYDVNVKTSVDTPYEFVNTKKMRFERAQQNNNVNSNSSHSSGDESSSSDLIVEEQRDAGGQIVDKNSTPIVVKLDPGFILTNFGESGDEIGQNLDVDGLREVKSEVQSNYFANGQTVHAQNGGMHKKCVNGGTGKNSITVQPRQKVKNGRIRQKIKNGRVRLKSVNGQTREYSVNGTSRNGTISLCDNASKYSVKQEQMEVS